MVRTIFAQKEEKYEYLRHNFKTLATSLVKFDWLANSFSQQMDIGLKVINYPKLMALEQREIY